MKRIRKRVKKDGERKTKKRKKKVGDGYCKIS